QFGRFATVGILQNGMNLGVFALGISFGVPYLAASLVAAIIALAVSFSINRYWTFPGTTDQTAGRAVRFVTVWLAFVVVALPTLAILVDVAQLPKILAQAIIIVVGAPASYLIQLRWTFDPNLAQR